LFRNQAIRVRFLAAALDTQQGAWYTNRKRKNVSYSIRFTKQEDGTYEAAHGNPTTFDHLPDVIVVNGHVEGEQSVDVTVRVDGLSATASRRDYKA
jgi:hypothetical protein